MDLWCDQALSPAFCPLNWYNPLNRYALNWYITVVGKWKHFFYFVLFPHISAMTKYFTSTQLLIFSTYGKIFQPQLFQHQNISTCPSFFCYGEIIFQITNFWIKRLLIRPKLFQHTTWIWLLWHWPLLIQPKHLLTEFGIHSILDSCRQ